MLIRYCYKYDELSYKVLERAVTNYNGFAKELNNTVLVDELNNIILFHEAPLLLSMFYRIYLMV